MGECNDMTWNICINDMIPNGVGNNFQYFIDQLSILRVKKKHDNNFCYRFQIRILSKCKLWYSLNNNTWQTNGARVYIHNINFARGSSQVL